MKLTQLINLSTIFPGADKVNAAKLSWEYASKYRHQHPKSPDVEKAYIKVIINIFELTFCRDLSTNYRLRTSTSVFPPCRYCTNLI